MGLSDGLDRMTINVVSPDRSVKAQFAGDTGISIVLNPRMLADHNERSLATQVNAALAGVLNGYSKGVGILREKEQGTITSDPTGTAAGERQQRYSELVAAITVSSQSPRGCVVVSWAVVNGFDVIIVPGMLERFNAAQIAQEINAALSDAMRRYGTELAVAHRAIYQELKLSDFEGQIRG